MILKVIKWVKINFPLAKLRWDSQMEIDRVGALHPLVEQHLHLSNTRAVIIITRDTRFCNERSPGQFV